MRSEAGLIYFAELKILHTFAVPKGEVLLRREISKFILGKNKEYEKRDFEVYFGQE